MTITASLIWATGITIWALIFAGVVLALSRSKERQEEPEMARYMSPGVHCELWVTPIQRDVLIRWIDEDVDAPKPLVSFGCNLKNGGANVFVPVYRQQAGPLCDLLTRKGMYSLARELRGEG